MTAWFLCSYDRIPGMMGPNSCRTCALNRPALRRAIRDDRARWSEVEVDGDQCVVKLVGSPALVTQLSGAAGVMRLSNREEAQARLTPTRRKPRWNHDTKEIEFSVTEIPIEATAVTRLDQDVRE